MIKVYIDSEEFLKQLNEKELTIEHVTEELGLDFEKANSVFNGYSSIGGLEVLKLTEMLGFDYNRITKKEASKNPPKIHAPKESYELQSPCKIQEHYVCEKCNYLATEVINFCPNCGEMHPEEIRLCEPGLITDFQSDHLRIIYTDIFNKRIKSLGVTKGKLSANLRVSQFSLKSMINGKKTVTPEQQLIISELLKAPINYLTGKAVKIEEEKIQTNPDVFELKNK